MNVKTAVSNKNLESIIDQNVNLLVFETVRKIWNWTFLTWK